MDELVLIMWYREDVRSPIYSIGKNFLTLMGFFLEILPFNFNFYEKQAGVTRLCTGQSLAIPKL